MNKIYMGTRVNVYLWNKNKYLNFEEAEASEDCKQLARYIENDSSDMNSIFFVTTRVLSFLPEGKDYAIHLVSFASDNLDGKYLTLQDA